MAEWRTWRNAVGWLLSGGALALLGNGTLTGGGEPSYYRGSYGRGGGYYAAPVENPAFGYDPRYDRTDFYQAGYEPGRSSGGGLFDWLWSRLAATRDVFYSRSSAQYGDRGYEYPSSRPFPPEAYGHQGQPQGYYRARPRVGLENSGYGHSYGEQWSSPPVLPSRDARARYDASRYGAQHPSYYAAKESAIERQQELAASEYEKLREGELPWQPRTLTRSAVSVASSKPSPARQNPKPRIKTKASHPSLVPPPRGIEPRVWGADDPQLAVNAKADQEASDEMSSDDREELGSLLESAME